VAEFDYYWLAAVAVVASFISLYYYLQVMRAMYVTPATETSRFRVPLVLQGTVGVLAVLVFVVGLYPQPLFDLTDSVSQVLFTS
jgi:NADH-quinone oxidoreductase subunit N